MRRRLLVVGAGPIGLAAALEGDARGFDVTVLERAAPGAALRRWGGIRFFSPLGMNVPSSFRRVLGRRLPADDALLNGPEFADDVLLPVAESAPLAGRVHRGHAVVAIGRRGLTRTDHARHPVRAERPFSVLAQTQEGEIEFEADLVLDATGVTLPCAIGSGGLPARGERAISPRFIRHLGDLERARSSSRGKRILLVGGGHSAANALLILAEIAEAAPETKIVWCVRTRRHAPVEDVADDPLPERARVVRAANSLAAAAPPFLSVRRDSSVASFEDGGSGLHAEFTKGAGEDFDIVAGFTGYRPDLSFLSELTLEISPATEGPARLAASLADVTDCLTVPRVPSGALFSGEPGFFLAGAKSYGRSRNFLLRTGLAQLQSILDAAAV